MELLTLTYDLLRAEKEGFVVVCKEWSCIVTQGETVEECKLMAIDATEMFLEELKNGTLHPTQYPKIKRHIAKPLQFQLSFDTNECKYVSLEKIATLKAFRKAKATQKAIKEATTKKLKRFKSVDELMNDLND